jgi:hypothetical protein
MGDSLATIYGGGDTAVTIVDTASTQLQLAFPNLRPSIKDFTHNDGAQQRLACLYGTIPTRPQTSNGPVYNIPVDVWLPTRLDSDQHSDTSCLLPAFLALSLKRLDGWAKRRHPLLYMQLHVLLSHARSKLSLPCTRPTQQAH